MKRLAIIVLVGCNRILGLPEVVPRDGSIEVDASTRCPAAGEVPAYRHAITQHLALACTNFQIDAAGDLAIAACFDPMLCGQITVEGPPDGPLTTMVLDTTFGAGHLDPDGSTLYARSGSSSVAVLRRTSAWTVVDMFDTGMLYPEISNVARAGNEVRLFVYGSGAVQEWSSQGDTWTAGATYAPADFGLGQVVSFQLAPDGLRAIIYGVMPPMMTAQMFYVDRPTLGARFGVAHTIELPLVLDAFMTADCTRVYFSGLDRIFYVDRR